MQIKRSNYVLTQRDYWRVSTVEMRQAKKEVVGGKGVRNKLKEQIIDKNRRRVGEIVH